MTDTAQVLCPGVTARRMRTGFISVDLAYQADPIAFTEKVIAEHAAEMGGMDSWRWRKEMERDSTAAAGQYVFEQAWIAHQLTSAREPAFYMALDGQNLVRRPEGPIRCWIDPKDWVSTPPAGQFGGHKTFALGVDVGEGVEQSDSTIVVMAAEAFEQAAAFNSNTIRPSDLGQLAAAVAWYYNEALAVVVRPMHGITTIRAMLDAGYGKLWRDTDPAKFANPPAERLGWAKGEGSSSFLFDDWGKALQDRRVTLHDLETIQQHRMYVYDKFSHIVFAAVQDLPISAQKQHGDLVVAAALAFRGCLDLPKYRGLETVRVEAGSYMAHRGRIDAKKRREAAQW